MEKFLKRSWLEINLEQIKKNYFLYKSSLPKEFKIMPVIKANAYGHGDRKIAKSLSDCGCGMLAVSNLEEAVRLREVGITGEILILGYTPVNASEMLYEYDITQTLLSREYAEALSKSTDKKIKCQFAIDTGMNRIGLKASDIKQTVTVIEEYSQKFDLNGIFTHLAVADGYSDSDVDFTKNQIKAFDLIAKSVAHLNLKYVHCLNSAGGLFFNNIPDSISPVVRLGIVLYGLKPSYENKLPEGILPALEWKSVISMVKTVKKGESIGYGRTFIADRDMTVATVSTGYADGYNRRLSNNGYVLIKGKRAPIVGRICMDQFMVDVSGIENVAFGDEAVLIGRSGNEYITADDMAQLIGTIGYEIICGISPRVSMSYI